LRYEREAAGLTTFSDQESSTIAQEQFLRATRQAQNGLLDEHAARNLLNALLALSGKASLDAVTIESEFNTWLQDIKRTLAEGTYLSYEHTVEDFLEFLGTKAKQSLATLTPNDIDGGKKSELKKGKAGSTVKLAIKTLRAALNRARRLSRILTNPADGVDVDETDSVGKEPFTAEQVRALWAVADETWKGMICFGFYLGPRIGDAARMRRKHVNLDAGTISYRQKKSKRGAPAKPVTTVLMPELLDYLRSRWQTFSKPDDFIFPTLAKQRVGGKTGLSAQFMNLIKAAGIPNEPIRVNVTGKGRKFYPLGFHSFRHTTISILENMDVHKEIRMLHVGHTSNAHERYSHRKVDSIRRALKDYPTIHPTSSA
jgi:integrase